jgi:ABC-2 type transport system permease protein
MNGYGHFAPALFWSITYWLSITAILAVVSIALARRGSDDAWPARLSLARQRASRLIPAATVLLLIAVGSGVWYYYNAHVLNEYLTAKDRRRIQANYERDFKKYEAVPQTKIIAVDANINIYPEHRCHATAENQSLREYLTRRGGNGAIALGANRVQGRDNVRHGGLLDSACQLD